jgi:hypothetical protein
VFVAQHSENLHQTFAQGLLRITEVMSHLRNEIGCSKFYQEIHEFAMAWDTYTYLNYWILIRILWLLPASVLEYAQHVNDATMFTVAKQLTLLYVKAVLDPSQQTHNSLYCNRRDGSNVHYPQARKWLQHFYVLIAVPQAGQLNDAC